METRYLATLIKVAETGSFSKAAHVMHLTQSAVSQRIKMLEEFLGAQLFDRSGSVLALTETGLRVVEKARTIIANEKDLLNETRAINGGKRLSLCCTPTFGLAYLPKILRRFLGRNTDLVDLKFIFNQPGQAVHGLIEREYDLAVIEHRNDLALEGFQVFPLPQDEVIFISSPQLEIPVPVARLEDLQRFRLYARRDGCSSKSLLQENLENSGGRIDDFSGVVISDDLRWTIQAVLAGEGIAYLSRSLVLEHLTKGLLCAHEVKGFHHYRHRSAITNKEKLSNPMVKEFLDNIFEVLPLTDLRQETGDSS